MEYSLTSEDFEKAFEFGVEYWLDPTKNKSGRTNSEPRAFGGTLDAFTNGKLIEIGIAQIIKKLCPNKNIGLDFDLKSVREVRTEPDIVSIKTNGKSREPKLFIEIKKTEVADRWIGPFQEQLNSIIEGSKQRPIYFIYASLDCSTANKNPKSADAVGMYLKQATKLEIFDRFPSLNAKVKLEFIFSIDELKKCGTKFPVGENIYETELFTATNIIKIDGSYKAGIKKVASYNNKNVLDVPLRNGQIDGKYGQFTVEGNFDIFQKKYEKSLRQYIQCNSDVRLENDVFGEYSLSSGNTYFFNLETVGRDPKLKRNNLFMAKRRVYKLIQDGIIEKPEQKMKKIALGL